MLRRGLVVFHLHALRHLCGASRQEFVGPGDLYDAEAARADVAETFQMAEGGDVDARVGGDLQDRFRFVRADGFPSMVRVLTAMD